MLSWRTPDGIGHRFDDETYEVWSPSSWGAICSASLSYALPDTTEPVDCMACIALMAGHAAA